MALTPEHVAQVHRVLEDPGPDPTWTYHTDEDYDALVRGLMASRPDGPGTWLFAYGSLIWKPELENVEARRGTAQGWHRSFCFRIERFRGTREQPGLMMSLDRGCQCQGIVFRLPPDNLEGQLQKLVRREITVKPPNNIPRWVAVKTDQGPLRAIAFVMNRQSRFYTGKLPPEEIADVLARACGHWGSCAEYLHNTVAHLEEQGIRDRNLWRVRPTRSRRKEGDRQTPEGFYAVTASQMNPKSKHYLSFDTGFPDTYDRAHGSTGSALMVHGTCSSAGCYAMTDTAMSEIYALVREALRGGQRAVQLQAYPFRMTAENLVRHRLDPNIAFWRQLKEGSDRFEATGEELVVNVSAGRYTFRPAKSPETEAEVLSYRAMEDDHMAVLLEEGRAAVRTTYADGGQHPSFTALWRRGVSLGEVSRPEALAYAGLERVITPARATQLACLGTGTCAPSAHEVKAISSPSTGEQPQPIAPLNGPSMWLTELPSLFTSAPVGVARMSLTHHQPVILGAQQIVPARLAMQR